MILITDEQLRMAQETEWTSSKGNQNKWFFEGSWYKEDSLGDYGTADAEVCVSVLVIPVILCYSRRE